MNNELHPTDRRAFTLLAIEGFVVLFSSLLALGIISTLVPFEQAFGYLVFIAISCFEGYRQWHGGIHWYALFFGIIAIYSGLFLINTISFI